MSNSFIIEVSARHIHLNRSSVDLLFGKNYELKIKKNLSQPGQFVCFEKLTVVGPKNKIENVSVLGPLRENVQVEISATDARSLGIEAIIRESGNLLNTPGCELVGPCGSLKLDNGVIVACRHIHATEADAAKLNVKNGDIVWVNVESSTRRLIFGDVVVRVSNSFSLAMHIDTDEANAANCRAGVKGTIIHLDV